MTLRWSSIIEALLRGHVSDLGDCYMVGQKTFSKIAFVLYDFPASPKTGFTWKYLCVQIRSILKKKKSFYSILSPKKMIDLTSLLCFLVVSSIVFWTCETLETQTASIEKQCITGLFKLSTVFQIWNIKYKISWQWEILFTNAE